MKKIVFILSILLLAFSCQDDVQFNDPAIEGIRDGQELWEATGYSVSTQGNLTVIAASNTFSTLELRIPNLGTGTYVLNSSSGAVAVYNQNGVTFSTANDGVGSPAILSDGEIVIEQIDGNGAIYGTFKFNAYDSTGQLTVNFIEGVIFNIR